MGASLPPFSIAKSYFCTATDNLASVIATYGGNAKIFLAAGATYTLTSAVSLPAGTQIEGNGATVTVDSTSHGAFTFGTSSAVTTGLKLRNIIFLGQAADATNSALNTAHVALSTQRAQDINIEGCIFRFWLGAGMTQQAVAGDQFTQRNIIHGNTFDRCYFGLSLADRAEFNLVYGNHFNQCRLGVWSAAGNNKVDCNEFLDCYGAYYSYAQTSPFGTFTSDNWSHGSFVGNTANHSNGSGGTRWTSNVSFSIGGVSTDPGTGFVCNGVLQPTFAGNTFYYTNITSTNCTLPDWNIVGSVLAQMVVTQSGSNTVTLVGCSQQTAVTTSGAVRVMDWSGVSGLVSAPTISEMLQEVNKTAGYDGKIGTGDPTVAANGYTTTTTNADVTGNSAIPATPAASAYGVWTADGVDSYGSEIQVMDNSTTKNGSYQFGTATTAFWNRMSQYGGEYRLRFRLNTATPAANGNNFFGFVTDTVNKYFGSATAQYVGAVFNFTTSGTTLTVKQYTTAAGATIGTLATDTAWHELVVRTTPNSSTAYAQLDGQAPVAITIGTGTFASGSFMNNGPWFMAGSSSGVSLQWNVSRAVCRINPQNVLDVESMTNIRGAGAAPTLTAGAALGTTPALGTATGNNVSCSVAPTTGTSPVAGVLFTGTFAKAYDVAPRASITAGNAASAALGLYVSTTQNGFTVGCTNAPAASTALSFSLKFAG